MWLARDWNNYCLLFPSRSAVRGQTWSRERDFFNGRVTVTLTLQKRHAPKQCWLERSVSLKRKLGQHQNDRKGTLMAIFHSPEAQTHENANSFETREPKLKMLPKAIPCSTATTKESVSPESAIKGQCN